MSTESPRRRYLAVPYKEKNKAKAAGARWDRAAKAWGVVRARRNRPRAAQGVGQPRRQGPGEYRRAAADRVRSSLPQPRPRRARRRDGRPVASRRREGRQGQGHQRQLSRLSRRPPERTDHQLPGRRNRQVGRHGQRADAGEPRSAARRSARQADGARGGPRTRSRRGGEEGVRRLGERAAGEGGGRLPAIAGSRRARAADRRQGQVDRPGPRRRGRADVAPVHLPGRQETVDGGRSQGRRDARHRGAAGAGTGRSSSPKATPRRRRLARRAGIRPSAPSTPATSRRWRKRCGRSTRNAPSCWRPTTTGRSAGAAMSV